MSSKKLVVLCALFCSVYAANLDETCATNEDCSTTTPNSECNADKKCSCLAAYVPSGTNDKCLKLPTSWPGKCEEDIQCTTLFYGDVSCKNNECACADGQHFIDGVCWKTLGIGDPCLNSNECYEEEYPDRVICGSDNVCVCRPGYEEGTGVNDNKCLPIIPKI